MFGFAPVHIDLHKSTYLHDGYPYIIKFSKEKNIPCKNLGVEPITELMTKDEILDGTKSNFADLKNWFSGLSDSAYYTAIFHPGIYDPESKSRFNKIREVDAENIVKINGVLDEYNVKLISYSDFMKLKQ